jgi:hypothetical protein
MTGGTDRIPRPSGGAGRTRDTDRLAEVRRIGMTGPASDSGYEREKRRMGPMRHTRPNHLWRVGSPCSTGPELTPALGTWFNCDLETGGILSLSLAEGDGGLILRDFGADDSSPCDRGQTPAIPHVSGLGSREVSGFTARYDFGLSVLSLAVNEVQGLLIIASFSTFRDESGRSSDSTRGYFTSEGDSLSS